MYWLGQPENNVFVSYKAILLGYQYPKTIICDFAHKSTGRWRTEHWVVVQMLYVWSTCSGSLDSSQITSVFFEMMQPAVVVPPHCPHARTLWPTFSGFLMAHEAGTRCSSTSQVRTVSPLLTNPYQCSTSSRERSSFTDTILSKIGLLWIRIGPDGS